MWSRRAQTETRPGEIARFELTLRAPEELGPVAAGYQLARPDGELLGCPRPFVELELSVVAAFGGHGGTGGTSAATGSDNAGLPDPIEGGCACRAGGGRPDDRKAPA
jgi:hypothetical protein